MWDDVLAAAALCAVALYCASRVQAADRRAALGSVLIVIANWAVCLLSWSMPLIGYDLSPASAFNNIVNVSGLLQHQDIWAISDAIAAMLILYIAYPRWWGFALWGLYTFQLIQHIINHIGLSVFSTYAFGMDLIFAAIIFVFILIGGKGMVDHVGRIVGNMHVRWFRGFRGALQCARACTTRGG